MNKKYNIFSSFVAFGALLFLLQVTVLHHLIQNERYSETETENIEFEKQSDESNGFFFTTFFNDSFISSFTSVFQIDNFVDDRLINHFSSAEILEYSGIKRFLLFCSFKLPFIK